MVCLLGLVHLVDLGTLPSPLHNHCLHHLLDSHRTLGLLVELGKSRATSRVALLAEREMNKYLLLSDLAAVPEMMHHHLPRFDPKTINRLCHFVPEVVLGMIRRLHLRVRQVERGKTKCRLRGGGLLWIPHDHKIEISSRRR